MCEWGIVTTYSPCVKSVGDKSPMLVTQDKLLLLNIDCMKDLHPILKAVLGICFWPAVIVIAACYSNLIDWLSYQIGWVTTFALIALILIIIINPFKHN